MLRASALIIYEGKTEIARHERLLTKGAVRVDLDHYLEVLLRKPGALPGATALEQARAAGRFTPIHDAWWAAACKAHGDAEGTRALIEVLMLYRHIQHEQVVAGLATALDAGALTADAVALEARKHDHRTEVAIGDPSPPEQQQRPSVRSLTEHRLRAQLPADDRPRPTVNKYDQLLPSRRENPSKGAAP